MKLTVALRDRLRKELRSHFRRVRKRPSFNVSVLTKEELLSVARDAEIDVEALNKEIMEGPHPGDMSRVLDDEELEIHEHSDRYPAFTGITEFVMTFEMIGMKVTRRVSCDWSLVPEWEYFDLHKRRVMRGWAQSSIGLSILAIHENRGYEMNASGKVAKMKRKPEWIAISPLLELGVLPDKFQDQLLEGIEAACIEEDARRRAEHGADPSSGKDHPKLTVPPGLTTRFDEQPRPLT
jgi:hypothetical protein